MKKSVYTALLIVASSLTSTMAFADNHNQLMHQYHTYSMATGDSTPLSFDSWRDLYHPHLIEKTAKRSLSAQDLQYIQYSSGDSTAPLNFHQFTQGMSANEMMKSMSMPQDNKR